MNGMTEQATRLLEEALKLPPEARAAIAGRLMESLDEHVDEDAEAAWAKEIDRRLKEVDSGKVTPIPWAEARRQILGKGNGPGNR
jgi:putative addiction module component (TIGR02574 family)